MAITFPSSPSNGDTSVQNGITYSYSSSANAWTAEKSFLPATGGQLSGNITFAGSQTVDGRDLSADGTKLDGIEASATADQTDAEIKTAIENATDIALGGNPTTTTQSSSDNSTKLATTAYVTTAVGNVDLSTKASLSGATFTGDITIPDKIIHSGDTNTAIRFPSADTVTIETGGSERMRINASGNVAIGNTDPDAYGSLIDNLVVGTTSGENGMTIASGTSNGGRICFADNTASPQRGMIEYSHADDSMSFNANGAAKLKLASAGQIGIGGANYGTSGQVLTSGGASAAPTWADAAGGATAVIASTTLGSAAASITLTGFSTTYDLYLLKYELVTVSGFNRWVMQVTNDSGTAYTDSDHYVNSDRNFGSVSSEVNNDGVTTFNDSDTVAHVCDERDADGATGNGSYGAGYMWIQNPKRTNAFFTAIHYGGMRPNAGYSNNAFVFADRDKDIGGVKFTLADGANFASGSYVVITGFNKS